MSRFAGEDLFGSGAHTFEDEGMALKHAVHEGVNGGGGAVTTWGARARGLRQGGELWADDLAGLEAQLGKIEAAIQAEAGELVDDLGRRFERMVMVHFTPRGVARVGGRLRMRYEAAWVQAG